MELILKKKEKKKKKKKKKMSFTLTLDHVNITSQRVSGTALIQNNPTPVNLWFYVYPGANKCLSPPLLYAFYVLNGGTVNANSNTSVTSFTTSISPGTYSMNVVAYSNGTPVLTSNCLPFTISNGSSLGGMNFNICNNFSPCSSLTPCS